MLLLTAAIWGTAFVFQEIAVDAGLPTFLFNALRFTLGGLVLLPVVWLLGRRAVRRGFLSKRGRDDGGKDAAAPQRSRALVGTLLGGSVMGLVLAAGSALQQGGMGDDDTGAGKAAFITGLYVVLVPVLGLAVGRRTGGRVWGGVGLALAGLFLLTINLDQGRPTIVRGDGLVLLGTGFWAAHILLIDRLTRRYDALWLSLVQFFVCAAVSAAVGLAIGERLTPDALQAGWHTILYCGAVAVGVAFTLQVVAQRHAHPTAAAIILSTEVLFGAVGGAVYLGETMTPRAYTGCGLMLAGMLLAQLAPSQDPVLPTPESA